MSTPRRYRRYDNRFKSDALRLLKESGRTVSDLARDLGIRRELLYQWKRQEQADGENVFPGKGNLRADQDLVRHLQRELKRVKQERDLLKKALVFFSKNER